MEELVVPVTTGVMKVTSKAGMDPLDSISGASQGIIQGAVETGASLQMASVTSTAERLQTNGRLMQRGADMLAHDIVDALVDNIMPTIDELDAKCMDMESEVVEHPKKETLTSIMQLKRSIMALNRIMSPQKELVNALARGEYSLISKRAQIYYRNIYDHLVRIEMLAQSLRELADSILATHLSSVSNRMNEVMKVLSIVASIFLPLTLMAGIYGMNFASMPGLQWRYGYFALLGIMAVVAVSLVIYFKRRKWV